MKSPHILVVIMMQKVMTIKSVEFVTNALESKIKLLDFSLDVITVFAWIVSENGEQPHPWGKKTLRSCPLCRKTSYFVVPSPEFAVGATKDAIVAKYIGKLKEKNVNILNLLKIAHLDKTVFMRI